MEERLGNPPLDMVEDIPMEVRSAVMWEEVVMRIWISSPPEPWNFLKRRFQYSAAVEVTPVEHVEVSMPLPDGMKITQVLQADPWHPEPEPLPFRSTGGRVRFTVPHVDIYRAVWMGGP